MLQPRYLLHTGEGDRFGEAVHHIDVYAFDSLGIYRKMFRDKGAHLKNGYRMPIDLPEGKWTFLCLGGKVGDYEIGILRQVFLNSLARLSLRGLPLFRIFV